MRKLLFRWHIAIAAFMVAVAVVLAKLLADHFGLEFISLGPLVSSIIAGGIFIVGLIVAGTLGDYKESERVPAEMVAALESILDDARHFKLKAPDFDLVALEGALAAIVQAFLTDLAKDHSRRTLSALERLSHSIIEMERLGMPPNYVVRLKGEQGTIRRLLLRVHHMQLTDFVPSAYILVEVVIALILGILIFTRIEPPVEAMVLVGFIAFIFSYMLTMLHHLDKPFHVEELTRDDVDVALFDEFLERLEKGIPEHEAL